MDELVSVLTHENNKLKQLFFVDLSPGTAVIHALMEALMHENNQVRELELDFRFDPAEKKILFKALSHAHNKVAKFTFRRLSAREIWAGIVVFHNLRCLLSARQVARIGKRAAVRRLPRELVGMVGEMLK
ncbi:hypothetical protein BASA81_012369 [Batrachochytrium salamandrivorans]|nr:hypothetical protein BASA81_012369 [Batrachochytrium salamandrivorans]